MYTEDIVSRRYFEWQNNAGGYTFFGEKRNITTEKPTASILVATLSCYHVSVTIGRKKQCYVSIRWQLHDVAKI